MQFTQIQEDYIYNVHVQESDFPDMQYLLFATLVGFGT